MVALNYIGSKYSLLSKIEAMLKAHRVPAEGVALDLFAGTGAAAQLLKKRGHVVYANDWQYYAYVTNAAFIEQNRLPPFETLLADSAWAEAIQAARQVRHEPILTYSSQGRRSLAPDLPGGLVLRYLDQLPGQRGPFYEAYCQDGEAGRLYFARDNGRRIQAIRDMIAAWRREGLISAREKLWLVACLLEAADRVANTASVYGAYLKHIKKTAQKRLRLVALEPIPSSVQGHRVFNEDGLALLERLQAERLRLIYLDPPYNHRQYSANYHILETIARWDLDRFEPRGVTGLRRAGELRSDFCLRQEVATAFRRLFERARADYLLVSYNNEGLLAEEDLLALFEEFCAEIHLEKVRFKRFRADSDHQNRVYRGDHTYEFLLLGRPQSTRIKTNLR